MSVLRPFNSSRRPQPLKDTDYDHEILLLDHTLTTPTTRSRSRSESHGERRDSLSRDTPLIRRHSDDHVGKRRSLRAELAKRKYAKYQDRREGSLGDGETQLEGGLGPCAEDVGDSHGHEGRPESSDSPKPYKKRHADTESVIDVLYENQRGCFFCGIPLFSSRALGAADAPAWTNVAQKPSATNITNAQVPDPSWRWAWKEWSINYSDGVDKGGWEYSFMFSKKFSWHGPSWGNSFVRRRSWVRKRVRKNQDHNVQEAHGLNVDYFTIHSKMAQSQTSSRAGSSHGGRYSIGQLEIDAVEDKEDICDIGHLMDALKRSRIDRERTEAVENFIKNGGDELYYLKDQMHEIMSQFIFQASRRHLLTHLVSIFDEASKLRDEHAKDGREDPVEKRRIENLEATIKAADEEVKRLEYWSDIKGMVGKGETKGAVDQAQGWDKEKWVGVDNSGPIDVISDRGLSRTQEANDSVSVGGVGAAGGAPVDKGKGKEKA